MRTPSAQTVRLQRRNGEYSAETLMQFGMAGGDLLLVDGGLPGDKLFPSVDGATSPGWEAIRPLFALGVGHPRRAACSVVPVEGNNALLDTHWMAVENGPRLASVALLPSRREEGRNLRVTLPVPWQGPTEGVVEGVKYGNWRKEDPLAQEAVPLELEAFFSPQVERSKKRGKRGHVSMEIELDGLKVIRLWPRGAEPYDRKSTIGKLGVAAFVSPETLYGAFRKLNLPPPSGFRYQPLREPDWLSGTMGGSHSSEVAPATHSRLPAWNTDGRLHGEKIVSVPNTVPWNEKSLFISFRPDTHSNYAYQLFQNDKHTWKGAWGMMVYARVTLTNPPAPRPGLPPPDPVKIWMGTNKQRSSVEMPLGKWQVIAAPYSELISKEAKASRFYIWPESSETREFVLELNGFTAIYNQDDNGKKYGASHAAIRVFKSAESILMLIEGEPGTPSAHLMRLEHPAHIKRAVVVHPNGYSGVNLRHHPAAQLVELHLPALPALEDGLSIEDAQNMFPDFRPQEKKTRVVVSLLLQR